MNNISISSGTIVRAILFGVLFYFLFLIKDVILILLTGIVIASAIEPGTRWFIRHRIPRIPAVLAIYLATAVIFVSAFYFLLVPLVTETANFLQTLPEYSQTLSQSQSFQNVTENSGDLIQNITEGFSLPSIANTVNAALSKISAGFFGTVDVIFGGIASFLLIIVLSFYLAVQDDGVGKFLKMVTPVSHEKYVVGLWERSKEKIGLWMQGQLLLAIIVGIMTFLGLTIIGIKGALLLAFFAAIFEIIPLFGPFLAAVPAVLVAFVDGGLTLALIATGLYVVIQQFESQLIYPLVVKKVIGVPPIISIIAIVVGLKLGGFLGVILSVPLATVLLEVLSDLEKRKKLTTNN
ncbi:MAG TPA: AI-2E family transporter [Candidatus Paceibacterota bacterium]